MITLDIKIEKILSLYDIYSVSHSIIFQLNLLIHKLKESKKWGNEKCKCEG